MICRSRQGSLNGVLRPPGRYGGYTLLGLALQQRLAAFPALAAPGSLPDWIG